jgi:hypothetical protein
MPPGPRFGGLPLSDLGLWGLRAFAGAPEPVPNDRSCDRSYRRDVGAESLGIYDDLIAGLLERRDGSNEVANAISMA